MFTLHDIKKCLFATTICIIIVLVPSGGALAWSGNNGFEGGVSSGDVYDKKDLVNNYKEVVFIEGRPIVFSGILSITKKATETKITTTYSYKNLKNAEEEATITRGNVVVETTISKKDNGQITESSRLVTKPSEVIKIGSKTYTLSGYEFSRACITDPKPSLNYFSGVFSGIKTYAIGTGTVGGGSSAGAGNIVVEFTGKFTGYDQYWGSCEVVKTDYLVKCTNANGESRDLWGGTAEVSTTSSTKRDVKYVGNDPYSISFSGGYVSVVSGTGVLEYNASFPEFSSDDIATDYKLNTSDSFKLELPLQYEGLPSHNLSQIRGHWCENDVRTLYALEIFKGNDWEFEPEKYMTRGEFASAVTLAAREVPVDPALLKNTRTTATKKTAAAQEKAIFSDVPVGSRYFEAVDNAFKRNMISGVGGNLFEPEAPITVADAITIFIRALGLESLAPNPTAITSFRDNDEIPAWARNSVYVAERIGLIKGDDRGYIKPTSPLTKARAAAMLNRLVNYLRSDILNDYEKVTRY